MTFTATVTPALDSSEISMSTPDPKLILRPSRLMHVLTSSRLLSRALSFVGVAYVVATLIGSASFLQLSHDFLANDFFWVGFTANHTAPFVANSLNLVVADTANSTKYSLTDPLFFTTDKQDQTTVSIPFSRHYARLVQYHRLTDIEHAIVGLRGTPGSRAAFVMAQYCWVDFERRWSLAHTQKRAERCMKNQQDNAAMYLEATMRNVDWSAFMPIFGDHFTIGIANALTQFPGGAEFLSESTNSTHSTVSEEATYWRSKGITRYVSQYHNAYQIGIDETIEIVNAVGMRRTFTIKKGEFDDRWSSKTTVRQFWGFANDLWAVLPNSTMIAGMSLVRNATNFYENANITMEEVMGRDSDFDWPLTPQDELLRSAVGPFGSVDLWWTMFPAELHELVLDVRKVVMEATRASEEANTEYKLINPDEARMTFYPSSWAAPDRLFVGGSPLCGRPLPVSYGLQLFRFDDTCGATIAETTRVDSFYFVFSALVSGVVTLNNSINLCNAAAAVSKVCSPAFAAAAAFVANYVASENQTRLANRSQVVRRMIAAMNVSMMQYAQTTHPNQTTQYSLLMNPVISPDPSDLWNAVGWWYLLDWATGSREVVSFEGDFGTLTLISGHSDPFEFPVNAAEIPRSLSVYLNTATQYVTGMLIAIATLVLLYALAYCFEISGYNLLEFNRVTAIVWVGRPLLLVRGVVAICILATSSPVLITDGSLTGMAEDTNSWLMCALAAGEVTWVVCVVVDVMLVWTTGLTYAHAPLCNNAVWLFAFVMQLVAPIRHRLTVDPQCSFVAIDRQVVCRSGTIEVGSITRGLVLFASVFVSFLVSWVVVRCCISRLPVRSDGGVLPGISQEVFERNDWIHEDEWYVDAASAAMTGLLVMPFRPVPTVFDIQKWTMLQHKSSVKPAATTIAGHRHNLRRALKLEGLRPSHRKDE